MGAIHDVPRNERGIALVMALLVLLVISLLAAILMASLNMETRLTGRSIRAQSALNNAEAGIEEAVARLRTGDIPDNGNPAMVAQIFQTLPGSVPALGADSVGLATAQPAGAWLDYSSATRGPDVLTVKYKTNAVGDTIYRWDSSKNPAVNTTSGFPIYVVTSTGRTGRDVKRIETEIVREPFWINVKAAMAANVPMTLNGNSDICGYNHLANTPVGNFDHSLTGDGCLDNENPAGGHLPGAWCSEPISSIGSAQQWGVPSNYVQNQAGFYQGPWEALQMTQSTFFSWVGAPTSSEPAPPQGIIYLDNNSTSQDQSGSFAYHGGSGEGFMYVDGDLTLNGTFNYRGLIYVEGNVDINGDMWVLGALICRGKTTIKLANGSCVILYSEDAIKQAIAKHGGSFVTLAWKELNL